MGGGVEKEGVELIFGKLGECVLVCVHVDFASDNVDSAFLGRKQIRLKGLVKKTSHPSSEYDGGANESGGVVFVQTPERLNAVRVLPLGLSLEGNHKQGHPQSEEQHPFNWRETSDRQTSSFSQLSPWKPPGQVQVWELIPSVHTPPFWQGLGEHSSILIWHS